MTEIIRIIRFLPDNPVLNGYFRKTELFLFIWPLAELILFTWPLRRLNFRTIPLNEKKIICMPWNKFHMKWVVPKKIRKQIYLCLCFFPKKKVMENRVDADPTHLNGIFHNLISFLNPSLISVTMYDWNMRKYQQLITLIQFWRGGWAKTVK